MGNARRRQRGGMGFGGLLVLLLVAGAIYAGYKFLPPMMNNFEFDNDVQQEARQAVYNGDSDDAIRAKLLQQADALNIPITARQIVIQHLGPDIAVAASYEVDVQLPGRTVPLSFRDGYKGILVTQEP